jgi:hypothetical protein
MPTETVIVVSAIIVILAVFTAILAWADTQTNGLKR